MKSDGDGERRVLGYFDLMIANAQCLMLYSVGWS